MERGVEARDLRHAGEGLAGQLDPHERGGLMAGCEHAGGLDVGERVVVDQRRLPA